MTHVRRLMFYVFLLAALSAASLAAVLTLSDGNASRDAETNRYVESESPIQKRGVDDPVGKTNALIADNIQVSVASQSGKSTTVNEKMELFDLSDEDADFNVASVEESDEDDELIERNPLEILSGTEADQSENDDVIDFEFAPLAAVRESEELENDDWLVFDSNDEKAPGDDDNLNSVELAEDFENADSDSDDWLEFDSNFEEDLTAEGSSTDVDANTDEAFDEDDEDYEPFDFDSNEIVDESDLDSDEIVGFTADDGDLLGNDWVAFDSNDFDGEIPPSENDSSNDLLEDSVQDANTDGEISALDSLDDQVVPEADQDNTEEDWVQFDSNETTNDEMNSDVVESEKNDDLNVKTVEESTREVAYADEMEGENWVVFDSNDVEELCEEDLSRNQNDSLEDERDVMNFEEEGGCETVDESEIVFDSNETDDETDLDRIDEINERDSEEMISDEESDADSLVENDAEILFESNDVADDSTEAEADVEDASSSNERDESFVQGIEALDESNEDAFGESFEENETESYDEIVVEERENDEEIDALSSESGLLENDALDGNLDDDFFDESSEKDEDGLEPDFFDEVNSAKGDANSRSDDSDADVDAMRTQESPNASSEVGADSLDGKDGQSKIIRAVAASRVLDSASNCEEADMPDAPSCVNSNRVVAYHKSAVAERTSGKVTQTSATEAAPSKLVDEFWVISGGARQFWRYENGAWNVESVERFLETDDPDRATIFWAHGYQTNMDSATKSGFLLKSVMEVARARSGSSRKFRLVVWKWDSERYDARIRLDAMFKKSVAKVSGAELGKLIGKLNPHDDVTLIGFSFGAVVVGEALQTLATTSNAYAAGLASPGIAVSGSGSEKRIEDEGRTSLILMSAACDFGSFSRGGAFGAGAALPTRVLNVYNPNDFALKFYPFVPGSFQAMGVAPLWGGEFVSASDSTYNINASGALGKEHSFDDSISLIPSNLLANTVF